MGCEPLAAELFFQGIGGEFVDVIEAVTIVFGFVSMDRQVEEPGLFEVLGPAEQLRVDRIVADFVVADS